MAHYDDMKSQLAGILAREPGTPLETMAELGPDCYVMAKVADPSRVFVHVAMGFHVEFTVEEAMTFADQKKKSLTQTINGLRRLELEVEGDLKSASDMISCLRQETSTLPPRRSRNLYGMTPQCGPRVARGEG
ncbi:unnamed protein product [Choristocarpus tenellus]